MIIMEQYRIIGSASTKMSILLLIPVNTSQKITIIINTIGLIKLIWSYLSKTMRPRDCHNEIRVEGHQTSSTRNTANMSLILKNNQRRLSTTTSAKRLALSYQQTKPTSSNKPIIVQSWRNHLINHLLIDHRQKKESHIKNYAIFYGKNDIYPIQYLLFFFSTNSI